MLANLLVIHFVCLRERSIILSANPAPGFALVANGEADHEIISQHFCALLTGGVAGRAIYIVREI